MLSNSTSLYDGIGGGAVLGSTHVDGDSNGTQVKVEFNPFAIAVLNSLEGQAIAFGGTIVDSELPLPASFPMFVLALISDFGLQIRKQYSHNRASGYKF